MTHESFRSPHWCSITQPNPERFTIAFSLQETQLPIQLKEMASATNAPKLISFRVRVQVHRWINFRGYFPRSRGSVSLVHSFTEQFHLGKVISAIEFSSSSKIKNGLPQKSSTEIMTWLKKDRFANFWFLFIHSVWVSALTNKSESEGSEGRKYFWMQERKIIIRLGKKERERENSWQNGIVEARSEKERKIK